MHPIFLTTLTSLAPAFELLLSGMLTVALVLSLVVSFGYLLIHLVNRYASVAPNTAVLAPAEAKPSGFPAEAKPSGFPPEVLAVLAASVEVATNGQGQISSIEKL